MQDPFFLRSRYGLVRWLPVDYAIRLREWRRRIPPVYSEASVRKELIFIHVPKTAGSSIGTMIFGTDFVGHYPWYIYRARNKNMFDKFTKFSVVRDPLSRCFSAYKFLRAGGKGGRDLAIQRDILESSDGFDDFVSNSLARFSVEYAHFVPQSEFLCANDRLMVDRLFKFECIPELFGFLSAYTEESEMIHINTSGFESMGLLSPLSKSIIKHVYAADYSNFGYAGY